MGTRLPGECLQQTQCSSNTGISRERQGHSFDRRRRVARPAVQQDLHTLQECGRTYAGHQARRELDYLSQRIGPCRVESSSELDELDKVDALDNRRPGCLAGQLVTPADIHRVADDEYAVLWVAPARPRRSPALLFSRGRVQLYPLHFSRRSLQFNSLAGLKKLPRIQQPLPQFLGASLPPPPRCLQHADRRKLRLDIGLPIDQAIATESEYRLHGIAEYTCWQNLRSPRNKAVLRCIAVLVLIDQKPGVCGLKRRVDVSSLQ